MKYWIIIAPWLNVNAMAIYPVVLIKDHNRKRDAVLINHEKIHLKQQLELLILPFYLIYLINYVINLVKFKNHDQAYRNIVFEKEAYQREKDLDYLVHRKLWSWWGELAN